MLVLLGSIGTCRWAQVSAKHAKANTLPVHGLKGKPGKCTAKKEDG
jgi:hypothetical protein